MAQIGNFTKDGYGYSGTIRTLTLNLNVTLEPVRSRSDKSPDFRVLAGVSEIGIAYRKTSEKGNAYLSLLLDDPALSRPIWCNLLLNSKVDGFPLMWERKRN